MENPAAHTKIASKLIDGLYIEAMVLADEARSYFDQGGQADRDALPPADRVAFSCESLKVTTRLMHIVSWLLLRRATDAGEADLGDVGHQGYRLGDVRDLDDEPMIKLPEEARLIVEASRDLYARIRRLDEEMGSATPRTSPARSLLDRLQRSL